MTPLLREKLKDSTFNYETYKHTQQMTEKDINIYKLEKHVHYLNNMIGKPIHLFDNYDWSCLKALNLSLYFSIIRFIQPYTDITNDYKHIWGSIINNVYVQNQKYRSVINQLQFLEGWKPKRKDDYKKGEWNAHKYGIYLTTGLYVHPAPSSKANKHIFEWCKNKSGTNTFIKNYEWNKKSVAALTKK